MQRSLQDTIWEFIKVLNWGYLFYPVILVIWPIIWGIIVIYIADYYSLFFDEFGNIINAMVMLLFLVGFIISWFVKVTLLSFMKRVDQLNNELFLSRNLVDRIELVESKIILVSRILRKLYFYKRLSFGAAIIEWKNMLTNKKILTNIRPLFYNFFEKECTYIVSVLTDLRSDLTIRLAEQQKTLEQAKSEVEQTIKGTTDLNQVSELQQARLDRQIEQFEELQRVLVRG
jgi:MFS family permease